MRLLLRTALPALCPALTPAGSPITSPPSFPLERACAHFPGAVTFPGACAARMPSTRWPQWRERRGQRAGLPPAPPHEVGPSLPASRGTRPARRGSAGAVLPHLGTSDHRLLSSLGSPKQEDSGPSEGCVLLRADSRRNRVCLESRPPPALALSNQLGGKVSPPSFTNTCPAPIAPVLVNAAEIGGEGGWDQARARQSPALTGTHTALKTMGQFPGRPQARLATMEDVCHHHPASRSSGRHRGTPITTRKKAEERT